MSSTTNAQNLLTNVFRPTFVYSAGTGYQSKLELTNIDTVSANTVTTFAANVGDASSNVYVGTGAGNAHSALAASSNTTDTFLGALAGAATSNVKNSVFLGFYAGYGTSNASNSISIGANTTNGGNSNIYIGCGTGIATGSNNIFLGPGLSQASVSNTLLVGSGTNVLLNGDLVNKRIGVNLTTLPTFDPSIPILLDVNGYARVGVTNNNGKLGVNIAPGYSLDVNGDMRVSDGWASLVVSHDASNTATLSFSNVKQGYSNATIQSAGGFYSTTGVVTASPTSILLKKGMFMVSAFSNNGVAYAGYVGISSDATHQILVSSNYFGTDINTGTNIITSNANAVNVLGVGTKWTITYFPTP